MENIAEYIKSLSKSDFSKQLDNKWKIDNIMSTLIELEKIYGDNVFNEMVKLFINNKKFT